jgi:N utilization substance protein A
MKGSRVQSIIRELRGEKIDIIEWGEDPAIFAANALSPAKVSKVTVVDFDDRKLQVTVENEQQSLAIGKRGQNVRLAAKLVGWDIDIRSEEEMKREIASQMEQIITAPEVKISSIEGISAGDSATLTEHGVETVEQLADATVDDLSDWLDLSVDEAQELLDMAQAITEARRAHAREQEQAAGAVEAGEEVEAPVEAAEEIGEIAVGAMGAEEAEVETLQLAETEEEDEEKTAQLAEAEEAEEEKAQSDE